MKRLLATGGYWLEKLVAALILGGMLVVALRTLWKMLNL
jgi:hypothetical protein